MGLKYILSLKKTFASEHKNSKTDLCFFNDIKLNLKGFNMNLFLKAYTPIIKSNSLLFFLFV